MLEPAFIDQLRSIFSDLRSKFVFLVTVDPAHPNRQEMVGMMQDLASTSPNFGIRVADGPGLTLSILCNDTPARFVFHAVPTGHEFSTLLLAILNLDGKGKNLPDAGISSRIASLKGPIHLQSYISLTCTNCPDVVQALNVMTILNGEITHEIIDGAINQEAVAAKNIQAVPTVYANGELLHVGRSDLGGLLARLAELFATDQQAVPAEAKPYDVIVAGGGPAGVTSAIYSSRKGLRVALVTDHLGGQLTETLAIDNMISVPQTTGNQLTANLKKHLQEYSLDLLENRKIESVELVNGIKRVKTSIGELLEAPALIIATGASWRRLNVPGESAYLGSGVAFCAHCDGPFYKGKRVAVIGGGNSGLEAAIDLARIAEHVTVIEFLDELKGDQVLQDKIGTLGNIDIILSAETLSIDGDGTKVISLTYRNRKSQEQHSLVLDGVFVQIGLKPNSQVFSNFVAMNRYGEIEIDAHCRTSVPGVYAAGDVSTVPYKQIVIAMGEGSKAALSAFEDKIKSRLTTGQTMKNAEAIASA